MVNQHIVQDTLVVVDELGDSEALIKTVSTQSSILNFGDENSDTAGQILFGHGTDTFTVSVGGAPQLTINASGVTVAGDLTVQGTTTTVNSTDLNITDNTILLNKDEVGAGITAGSAGIEIERGSLANVNWLFNETEDHWEPTGPAGTLSLGNLEEIDLSSVTQEVLTFTSIGAITVPSGTTGQQPGSPVNGMLRYNQTLNQMEARIGGSWQTLNASPPGSGFLPLIGGTMAGNIVLSTGVQIEANTDAVATTPTYSFGGDLDTGVYRFAVNTLGFSAGGGPRLTISSTVIDAQGLTLTNINDPVDVNGIGDRGFNDLRYVQSGGDTMIGNLNTQNVFPDGDSTRDIGSVALTYANVYADDFIGVALQARYADLAERFEADMDLYPGTVVVYGGEAEITMATISRDTAVAGIIATDPALMMNCDAGPDKTHPYLALKGKVPCKVIGKVKKGDLLVTSDSPGYGKSSGKNAEAYTAFARALEDSNGDADVIYVSVI